MGDLAALASELRGRLHTVDADASDDPSALPLPPPPPPQLELRLCSNFSSNAPIVCTSKSTGDGRVEGANHVGRGLRYGFRPAILRGRQSMDIRFTFSQRWLIVTTTMILACPARTQLGRRKTALDKRSVAPFSRLLSNQNTKYPREARTQQLTLPLFPTQRWLVITITINSLSDKTTAWHEKGVISFGRCSARPFLDSPKPNKSKKIPQYLYTYLSPLARHVVFESLARAFHGVVFSRQRCPPLQKNVHDGGVSCAAGAMQRRALPLVSCIDDRASRQGRRVGGVECGWGEGGTCQ